MPSLLSSATLPFPATVHIQPSPSEDEVRNQLRRILASSDLPSSERNRRFLRRVVECTLRGEKQTGYDIATCVFGRPATFNATTDPIVRIEASKLRRDLETYYLKSGRHDPVIIALPKGGYRTTFSYNEATRTHAGTGNGVSAEGLAILRAALLGWSARKDEADRAWRELLKAFPDFFLDPRVHGALTSLTGSDTSLRDLLLEGLRRAGGR